MEVTPIAQIEAGLNTGYRVFIIRGAAGTGKTTLIRALVPFLSRRGFCSVLLAPTGRAALNLSERSSYEASTIHSEIFNISDEPIKDEQGDAQKWIFPLKDHIEVRSSAFLIDEASMVGLATHNAERELLQFGSGSLLNDLIQYVGVKNPSCSNLLFFVGDRFQLPPVGERCEIPPALDALQLERLTGLKPCLIELTHVYRQEKVSGILEEATKIRQALQDSDFNRFVVAQHEDVLPAKEGYSLAESWCMRDGLDEKIIIAYTNKRVRELNQSVREALGISSSFPVVGDRLLSIRNTRLPLGENVQQSGPVYPVYNGDFLRVRQIAPEAPFKLTGFYRPKDSDKTSVFEYTFLKMSVEFVGEASREYLQDVWVNITPILSSEWDEAKDWVTIALYNGVKRLIEERYAKSKVGREKEAWVRDRLKESQLLHAPIVKFGYAVTGHKSQGGEWREVWADYADAERVTSWRSRDFFRWAYTVTTRATKRLYLLGEVRHNALLEAVSTGSLRFNTEEGRSVSIPEGESLKTLPQLLKASGYEVVGEICKLNYRYRLKLKKCDTGHFAHVDFLYRKNLLVSGIESSEKMLPSVLEVLKGKPVEEALGEYLHPDALAELTGNEHVDLMYPVEIPEMEEVKRGVVQRVIDALQVSGSPVKQVKNLTVYQVRVIVSIGGREVFVDLDFDKKSSFKGMRPSHDFPSETFEHFEQALKTLS